MIQAIGEKLVCVYSQGTGHSIGENIRAVYARNSTEVWKTWTPGTVVANMPKYGEVAIGNGLDSKGEMLLWVRRIGKGILRRRVVAPKRVMENPLNWPASEAVAIGSRVPFDSGNVNAYEVNGSHHRLFIPARLLDNTCFCRTRPDR